MTLLDRDAEIGVLGAFLIGLTPAQAHEVRTQLPLDECFGIIEHRHVYRAIGSLLERGVPIDPLTLRDECGRLQLSVDMMLIATASDWVPTSANALFHAKIVRDLWLRREHIRVCTAGIQRAESLDVPVELGYAETVSSLVHTAAPTLIDGAQPLTTTLHSALESLVERGTGVLDPGSTPTGLEGVDRLLGGFAPDRLIVLAARPKQGKTSLALKMARVAAEYGTVYHVSLEMGRDELSQRLILAEAGVTHWRGMRFTDEQITRISAAAGRLYDLPLLIDTHADTPGLIRMAVQSLEAQGKKPALVVVDYLQLMRWPGKADNRNVEVGKLTRALKRDVAMALHVPVLCLSQLNRGSVEGGKSRPPVLSDLRDSGSIEQDADQVVMLHYAGDEDGRTETAWGPATRTELYVRGNRHGPGGKLDVYYNRRTGEWRDLDTRHLESERQYVDD